MSKKNDPETYVRVQWLEKDVDKPRDKWKVLREQIMTQGEYLKLSADELSHTKVIIVPPGEVQKYLSENQANATA